MTPERWKQTEELYHAARALPADARTAFLADACRDDDELRREVELLLNQSVSADRFLAEPALAMAAHVAPDVAPAALTGRRVGGYHVHALLGVGGMGEVYRARDTKLGRDVAIKILPRGFTSDPERLARFEREARMLAALNHPNICAIHGVDEADGLRFLILELVDGETLAERIARTVGSPSRGANRMGLTQEEALAIARQIADALDAAHQKGVIHRDLKPANIKITPDGVVKVLDLGLAKAVRADSSGPDLTQSPTVSIGGTREGVILGTPAYMSPEQARGKVADKRADIWAFGCVLYEMLTGRPVFAGDTISDTIARVLERDPEWGMLPPATPPSLTRLLQRCLDKDPKRRLHDIADARIEIEDLLSGSSPASGASALLRPQQRPTHLPWAVAALALCVALVATGALVWNIRTAGQGATPPRIVRLSLATSGASALALSDRSLAFTPDGSHIVYIGDNRRQLWVRALDRLDPTAILTAAAPLNFVFVSPDGQWVGFIEGNTLKTVAITGGPVATLAGAVYSATWAPDDTIIVADDSDPSIGLSRVPAAGGATTVLTRPVPSRGEHDHFWPEMLPGGGAVLFTIGAATGGLDAAQVAVLDLATLTTKVLVAGGSDAHFVAIGPASAKGAERENGYLVYTAGGTLRAISFDLARLETHGAPVTVLPRLATTAQGGGHFDVATDGTLVYVDAPAAVVPDRPLVWVDRQGREEPLSAPARAYFQPRVSPDGTRIAVAVSGQEGDIWVWDLARQQLDRRTFGPTNDFFPVWTRDGNRLIYSSGGVMVWQPADGTGAVEQIGPSGRNGGALPTGVTPDGTRVIFSLSGRDLMVLELPSRQVGSVGGERVEPRVEPIIQTSFNERNGVVSNDGRWLAYESDSSGRFEVYVRPFPDVNAGHWSISTSGGARPAWAPSGQELFFEGPSGALMAVQVDPRGGAWNAGSPVKVVEGPYMTQGAGSVRQWDVSNDGRRFLMIKQSPTERVAAPQIVVVQNWFEELKQLVPVPK